MRNESEGCESFNFIQFQISAPSARARNRLRESPGQAGAHIPDVPKAGGPPEALPQDDLSGKLSLQVISLNH